MFSIQRFTRGHDSDDTLTRAANITTSSPFIRREMATLVAMRVMTERMVETSKNQVTTLMMGPWLVGESTCCEDMAESFKT